MNKFFEALANVFRMDLRKRVLFTLGLLAIYRIGAHIPTPGIDYVKFEAYFTRAAQSGFSWVFRFVQRRQRPAHDDFCLGHYTLYHFVHHSAVAYGSHSDPRQATEKKAN